MTPTDPASTFLSKQDLADRYGVPVATVSRWVHYGTGPRSLKIGKHRRFRLADVIAWENDQADDRTPDAVA